jgi:hypothetical protein
MFVPAENFNFWPLLAGAIPDLQPIEQLLPPTFWEQHRYTILLGSWLTVVIAVALVWWLRHARPVVKLPPAEIARIGLQKLESGPDNGYLAGVVLKALREYLCAAISILPRGELTVDEIIPQLQKEKTLPPELKEEIATLLRQCEQRQFFSGRLETPGKLATRTLDLIGKIEAMRIESTTVSGREP